MKPLSRLATIILGLALISAAEADAQPAFHLRTGDRVVFYGDSITDQRLYTTLVETFVLTRFPSLDVRFIHSGWGGDRVTGGTGGPIDVRLERDVLAHRPTVVTVMLGMNDGRYRPFEQPLYDAFAAGYRRLVDTLKSDLPRARITLIQPSPYDDVTRPPFEGGSYNDVMRRFGAFIKKVASDEGLGLADFNTDLVHVLETIQATDPKAAAQLIPDRVHPTAAGHLVLAGALLKAWHAPALVSSVELNAGHGRLVQARNSKITELTRVGDGLHWLEVDAALPMPIDTSDALTALAAKTSRFVETLNQQPLKVSGLKEGPYALRIDDEQIGVFTAAELAKGVNLAVLPTPMLRQANEVHALTLKHNDIYFTRWRYIQTRLEKDQSQRIAAALDGLDALEEELIERQHKAAHPRARRFEIVPVPVTAAGVPVGFTPVFGRGDLHYALLTADRHKDVEVYLEVDGAAEVATSLLLRWTNGRHGYRITLDSREKGALGRVETVGWKYGQASKPVAWRAHWKDGGWNALRVRIEGDRAHVSVWLNDVLLTDWKDDTHGEDDGWGLVGLESLASADAGAHLRNIAIKRLP